MYTSKISYSDSTAFLRDGDDSRTFIEPKTLYLPTCSSEQNTFVLCDARYNIGLIVMFCVMGTKRSEIASQSRE